MTCAGRYVQPGNLAYANGGMSFDGRAGEIKL